ncbi:MAG: hypothetical protein KC621_21080, partial [Myxococcales bacterium]|nr:hypothetical protein [Myxococcales bacterium]
MSDEMDPQPGPDEGGFGEGGSSGRKRRRRRRRRKGGGESDNGGGGGSFPDDVLLVDGEGGGGGGSSKRGQFQDQGSRGGRRQVDVTGPVVSLPSSGRNPWRKRSTRSRRGAPGSAAGRRRRLSRAEVEELTAWLSRMPDTLLASLYRGLGGQPDRVASTDRVVQLAVRALVQGGRTANLAKAMNERERKALAALLQGGCIAHADELHRELVLSYGSHERDWARVMVGLASRGVIFASTEVDSQFFYVVPEPLVDGFLADLGEELSLPTFSHPDVRVMDAKPFCPPLHFSVTTLATYIDQFGPRLTQRHEIYRHDQEQMDQFFAQIWEPESELFSFHLQFLMMHGMVELRGEYLALQRDVMEEWLQLEPEDQRDLVFRALERRFEMAEWVLWAVHATDGEWVAERPLGALYRHWKRGKDWRQRYTSGAYAPTRSSERDSFTFSPLVQCGLMEMGQWGQEKF